MFNFGGVHFTMPLFSIVGLVNCSLRQIKNKRQNYRARRSPMELAQYLFE